MPRTREKQCDRCKSSSEKLFRVQFDDSQKWYFVCHACWTTVQANNPNYRYGGTWKSKKRR